MTGRTETVLSWSQGLGLQGAGLADSAGAEQGQQSEVDRLQQRMKALEKELSESENTHRLR